MALTIKHTVEFSNNRRTPLRSRTFQAQNPIRGNLLNLPDPILRRNPARSEDPGVAPQRRCPAPSRRGRMGRPNAPTSEMGFSPGPATRLQRLSPPSGLRVRPPVGLTSRTLHKFPGWCQLGGRDPAHTTSTQVRMASGPRGAHRGSGGFRTVEDSVRPCRARLAGVP